MNILISGGTGFIGSELCAHLLTEGHTLVVKTRHPELVKRQVKAISSLSQLAADESFDVVINLAGEPIADKRWTRAQKKRISESRLMATQELIEHCATATHKPELFISGSAIGYYGVGSTEGSVDEASSGDDSFSSKLCSEWEACALQAESLGIRTCLLRTGIVLGKNGGALQKMVLPFKLGLGGKIGSGTQWMSWIHLQDLIAIIDYCINHDTLSGPINGTAPYPATNAAFTVALGKAMHRPTPFSMPAKVVELLMGEMGKELLLAGKLVLPAKIEKTTFKFQYERLDEALADIL
jgi:uncharacterized protein (TIGR01777 family)